MRSVYLPSPRGHVVDTLAAFDAPDSEFVTGDRDETTVATQALFLMNDGEVLRLADAFADRLMAMDGKDKDRIRAAFELAYGRPATSMESKTVLTFLRDYAKEAEAAIAKEASSEPAQEQGTGSRRERQRERARQRARDRAAASGGAPPAIKDPKRAAWSAFAQSLFQGAEFRIIG